jgi:hypothetical protein
MMWQSEAERLFNDEVRDKKKTASGVHHKTGKNGYVGKMRFPSDIMSRKEKRKYKGNSKVSVSNMYDEIISIEKFEQLEEYEQRNMLAYWRNTYSNKTITDGMGIWNARYYRIVADLGLPKAKRVDASTEKKPRKAIATTASKEPAIQSAIQSSLMQLEETPPAPVAAPPAPVVQEIIVEGLHLSFIGTYDAEKIQKQLSKFDLMLEGEDSDFYIEMKIMQKAPKEKQNE